MPFVMRISSKLFSRRRKNNQDVEKEEIVRPYRSDRLLFMDFADKRFIRECKNCKNGDGFLNKEYVRAICREAIIL